MAAIASNGIGGGVWSLNLSWAGGVVPAEGDTVQILATDTITLDTTVIVGADTTTPAIDILSGGSLLWDNAGSDELTLKGDLYVRTGGTLNFDGTTTLANTLTIKLNYSGSLAANKYRVFLEANSTFISNGYNKTRPYDLISVDAASGQAVVTTTNDNSSIWSVGDSVIVTQTTAYGSSTSEAYTINSFSAKEITMSGNFGTGHLAFYGYVANMSRNILWTVYNTSYSTYFYVDGKMTEYKFRWSRVSYVGRATYCFNFKSGIYSPFELDYNVVDNTSMYAFVIISQVNTNWESSFNIFVSCGAWLFSINGAKFHDNMTISSGLSGVGGIGIEVYDNIFVGTSSTCLYGWGGTYGSKIHNNRIICCNYGVNNSNFYTMDIYNNEYYGTIIPIKFSLCAGINQHDEIVGSEALPNNRVFDFSNGAISSSYLTNIKGFWTDTNDFTIHPTPLDGSRVNVSRIGADDIYYTIDASGYIYKTGTGLADTTSRDAGGYATRFESKSSTIPLQWQQEIPTGNIQNKLMVVGVWCKINNAAYWAGTHQLPRLTVLFDDATTIYYQASETTDWQFLYVSITPTTTFGSIKATLSTMTDATTTNAYVYFDDYAVLYPAGVQLNLGGMTNWSGGLPVMPTIATNFSAQDVWTALDSTDYGANTMGNRVKKLKNPSILIDNEIIV